MADGDRQFVTVSRALPQAYTDGLNGPLRGDRYRNAMVQPVGAWRAAAAAEGSLYVATNPTPGTAIAGISATGAFSDQESLLYVRNGATSAEGTTITLDTLELIVAVAGTNGTNVRFVSKVDAGDRAGTGGSTITPVNPNMASSASSSAVIKFGALATSAASASARLVQNGLIRSVITVVGDRYIFAFGADPVSTGMPTEGSLQAVITIPHRPVILGPGDCFVFSVHAAAQTVASEYEFNLSYVEK